MRTCRNRLVEFGASFTLYMLHGQKSPHTVGENKINFIIDGAAALLPAVVVDPKRAKPTNRATDRGHKTRLVLPSRGHFHVSLIFCSTFSKGLSSHKGFILLHQILEVYWTIPFPFIPPLFYLLFQVRLFLSFRFFLLAQQCRALC